MSIGIVKTVKAVGKRVGSVIDSDDRVLAGQIVIWSSVLVFMAGAAGLALRVFNMAAG